MNRFHAEAALRRNEHLNRAAFRGVVTLGQRLSLDALVLQTTRELAIVKVRDRRAVLLAIESAARKIRLVVDKETRAKAFHHIYVIMGLKFNLTRP